MKPKQVQPSVQSFDNELQNMAIGVSVALAGILIGIWFLFAAVLR
jgi:hypothetical protein